MAEKAGSRGRRNSILGGLMARKYENRPPPSSEAKKVSNRDLLQGVASSFLEAAYQRFRISKETDVITIDDDYEQFIQTSASESSDGFWKDENFRQEYEQESSATAGSSTPDANEKAGIYEKSKKTARQEHFIDILLDKMISTILPEDFPEREQFTLRVNDPVRKKRQTLSATIFAHNLKVLTTKLGILFELQDCVIRLISWRNPSGTVTMLILLTMICFNPIYLAIIPLLYILYGLIVPAYIHRHPPHRTFFLPRHTYGKSLIVSLASGGKKTSWHPSDDIKEYDYNPGLDQDDIQRAHHIKQSMEFVVNLRDLQNSMSAMVSLSRSMEKFIFGTAGFKDEHRSTALFLAGLGTLLLLWLISPLINWSIVSSVGLWSLMVTIHPKIRSKLARAVKREQMEKGKEVLIRAERYDILLDEPPDVRFIELFEIYKRGLMPKDWTFLKYSSNVFDPQDPFRKAQTPPPGVDTLEEVQPPLTWSFDNNSKWEIDFDAAKWSRDRNLFHDVDSEFLVDDQFKRRRLVRKVLRYAGPARKPSYK
ncbi:LADA_0H19262g1_1 [Lachancea dasiensis]|uniref:LADA_0H19262g1_1 n=1 Tax=Lachancea dasiensis TaxID=1072105 RepID=A0A1G4K6G2_9SACH|nr:LADA_0H19262g1_1 [Lachancea dasiensis]